MQPYDFQYRRDTLLVCRQGSFRLRQGAASSVQEFIKSHKKGTRGPKGHLGIIEGISTACSQGKCYNCTKVSCAHECHPKV